jgi:hypothetical protein
VGVLAAELDVFRRQLAKAFGGQAKQQGDRAVGPDIWWQGIVGQTALEEPPAIVVVEQVLGFLARDGWDGQFAGEPAARGPFQEVADQLVPLVGGPDDPVVDVLLGEVGEGQSALVHPGQEIQGAAGRGRRRQAARPSNCPPWRTGALRPSACALR